MRHPPIITHQNIKAVLGPTNTGKTHFAIERMLAHGEGIIGLPLRLLAREVYNFIVNVKGKEAVSLITGEEKILPPKARYGVYTVEALPQKTNVAFVAIDEVQLCADFMRGHIFTDRLLHLRGGQETLWLGAQTMQPILEKLVPGIEIISRPRFSTLTYSGIKKISRLPRRSAVIAFSTEDVYAIAEFIRRQRGGAAVVTGALSPRTRNAQVELYQSGDVDFIVATDAIGMGLNLDIEHVAFAQIRKYDGYQLRYLTPSELAQIAGRAGRHMRDGTFGLTTGVEALSEETIEAIETHDFAPIKNLQWRNRDLSFRSLEHLHQSLSVVPDKSGLVKALPAVDLRALETLMAREEIKQRAGSQSGVKLLWQVCALPDYQKISPAHHSDLIERIYSDLCQKGFVDEDYLIKQIANIDRLEGDIDILSQRIAQIRTWTFVSHQPKWLANQQHWQEKTREIENRLSDALHERLTKRFVDRRTSFLMRRLRENTMMDAQISQSGDVMVEDHYVGKLDGFRFHADMTHESADAKALRTAVQKILTDEYEKRAAKLASCANGDLSLGSDGIIRWIGQPVASLVASEDILAPRLILLADDQLLQPARESVVARLERFVKYHFETALKPLFDLAKADALVGITRGLAYRLVENFGILLRKEVASEIKSLDQISRAALRRLGVRFGAFYIFLPMMLKPAPAQAITLLWSLKHDGLHDAGYGEIVPQLAAGRTSIVTDPSFNKQFYALSGYRIVGKRAARIDILERLADLIRPTLHWKPQTAPRPDGGYDGKHFTVTTAMMSILGATAEDMEEILKHLGYRAVESDDKSVAAFIKAMDESYQPTGVAAPEPVGPFAQLAESDSDSANTEEAEAPAKPVLLWHQVQRSANRHIAPKREPNQHQPRAKAGAKKPPHANGAKPHSGKAAPKLKEGHGKEHKPRFEGRQNVIDPHSPFAALAALREQLKK